VNVLPLWAGAATVLSPALRLMLRARARRGKEIGERLAERRGLDRTPRPGGRLVWLHASSIGETVSVLPVLQALAARSPDIALLLTTGTVTSARLLGMRLGAMGLDERVLHRFVPLDVPAWVARFLDHWRPDAAVFVESELWPNIVRACRRRAIPLMLVNARLSPRSFARWRLLPSVARRLLAGFARIEAQSDADAARLRRLGAPVVSSPGNLKFAAEPLPCDDAELCRLRTLLGGRPVWLAASIHPGEEALAFAVHRALAPAHPGLLTVVVPRHPERGPAVLAAAAGLAAARRGAGDDPPPRDGVWIADTVGELGLFYRLARIAFVGRSLLPPGGGQNPLEAAKLGCAVAVGPHTANFAAIVETLSAHGAIARVADADALAAWVGRMLAETAAREAAGAAGLAAAARYADLPGRTAATILGLLPA
jgi:3-deoxy-D-manno-octulosonic-acid transferase